MKEKCVEHLDFLVILKGLMRVINEPLFVTPSIRHNSYFAFFFLIASIVIYVLFLFYSTHQAPNWVIQVLALFPIWFHFSAFCIFIIFVRVRNALFSYSAFQAFFSLTSFCLYMYLSHCCLNIKCLIWSFIFESVVASRR